MRRVLISTCVLSVTLWSALPLAAQNNWPQLRGADSRGFVAGADLPDRWSTTENVAWKTDIPGRGWSSPIVWGDKIFLTTCVNSGETEDAKKGLYFGGERPKPPETEHEWKVICLDLNTGKILWEQTAHKGIPATPRHVKNSYASETPVTDGQRVYAYFGNVGVFCYDLDGKPLWKKELEPRKTRFAWGTAASPVVYEGRVYIVNDNDEESYLLALDARNGDELFRVMREDEKSNWATPYIWKNSQRVELITPGTKKNRSYDLEGRLLWELGGMSSITIATPYSEDDVLYISSGYVLDKRKPIFAIRPGASGDITLEEDQDSNEYILWRNQGGPYNPSTLLYDGLLYTLYDRGFFACFDPATGEEVYERKRIPNGRAFTSSPWAAGGKIFCLNEDGVTFVIKAGREFEILHTNKLADDDMCMATPAIVGDRLLIRTAKRIYCMKKGAKLEE